MSRLLSLLLFSAGLVGGILLQRFMPIGAMLHRLGLRELLPIPRQSNQAQRDPNWDVPAAERGHLKLFILAGQSNMSGRGSLEDPAAPQPDFRVYAFNKDFRWAPAREPLGSTPAEVDPVASDGGTGVGPGLAFALALLDQHPDWRIGLIPCARGASLITEWQRDLGQNSLYGSCLRRIRAASAYGEVTGLLFAQGEGDADDPARLPGRQPAAATWQARFTDFVSALRADLGRPEFPVVFAQLGAPPLTPMPNWQLVRDQQAAAAGPALRMVITDDLETSDGVHFTTTSQVALGQRLAAAWLDLHQAEQP